MPDQLRRLRKHLGLTQEALAEVLGVSRKALGEYERGKAPIPRQTMLAVLCLALWATLNPATPTSGRSGAA